MNPRGDRQRHQRLLAARFVTTRADRRPLLLELNDQIARDSPGVAIAIGDWDDGARWRIEVSPVR